MYAEAFRGKVYNYTSNDSVLGQGWGVGGDYPYTQRENKCSRTATIVSSN